MFTQNFFYSFFLFYLSHNEAIHVKLIPEYYWNRHRGRVVKCDIPCEFSADPQNPDAEFHLANTDQDVRNSIGPKSDHIKIIGSGEGQHYYPLINIDYLKKYFHATSLLDRRSDIPMTFMPNMDNVKAVEMPKHPKPKATFVSRNCGPKNKRNDYVREIDKAVGVVSLSSCLHNTQWPQCNDRLCTKVEAIRDYKLYLAFENGNSPGYVTEKIYHALEAGVLPVYLGTRDVASAVPKGSYIDVAAFDTPHDVASYLKKVLDNETLYSSYFEWKHKPFDPEFDKVNRVLWGVEHYCRVCYYVDAVKRGVGWDHLHQTAVDRIPGRLETSKENNETKVIGEIENKIEELKELYLDANPDQEAKHRSCDCSREYSKNLYFAMSLIVFILPGVVVVLFLLRKVCNKHML